MSPHIAALFLFLAVFDTAPVTLACDGASKPLQGSPRRGPARPFDGDDVQGRQGRMQRDRSTRTGNWGDPR